MIQERYLVLTDEFKERVKAFNDDFYQKYKKISEEPTPQVDGSGKKIVEKRPDGYDYIIEAYMRERLDKHFPGWSWEAAAPLQFLGSEWVVAQGHLVIIDEHLVAFGISPPVRKFFGVDSVRIQYKSGSVHTDPKNIVDVGDNCKQANTAALKYAINRLTHIGDDIYGKRIEEEGAGSYEDVLESSNEATTFGQLVGQYKLRWSEVFGILEVQGIEEITDYAEAWKKIKERKGLK